MSLEAIKYHRGKLLVLNQLLLPFETKYEEVSSVKNGWDSINLMKVRGAPAISIVAALSLAVEIDKMSFSSKEDLNSYIVQKLDYLATSRPTAINLYRVINLLKALAMKLLNDESINVNLMKDKLIMETEKLLKTDIEINKAIGKLGGQDIMEHCKAPVSVLTHCNTGSLATAGYGTALGVIKWLHEQKVLHHAYCTETRPYNQGARLTAYELGYENIPSTLICDSMVSALMKSGRVSAVVVGADRVVANGDTANKIGTYQVAIAAKYHKIPFYVACPKSSFDFSLESGDKIPIEERPSQEMTSINGIPVAAEGIGCWNPAFDVTPAELITGGIITEIGVFSPHKLKDHFEQLSSLDLLK